MLDGKGGVGIEKARNQHLNGCHLSIFYVPLRHLPSSMVGFAPCDQVMQRANLTNFFHL